DYQPVHTVTGLPDDPRPSGRRSVIRPLLRSESAHRKRVDLFAHALTQRAIDDLVLLHPALAAELGADDHSLEMMAIADHLDVFASQTALDVGPDLIRCKHGRRGFSGAVCSRAG